MLECMDLSGSSPAFDFAAAKETCKIMFEDHYSEFIGMNYSINTQKVYRFPRHAKNSWEPRPAIKLRIYVGALPTCRLETTLYFYYDFLTDNKYYQNAELQVVDTFWDMLTHAEELRDIAAGL